MKKTALLLALTLGLSTTAAHAQFKYIEGRDYQPIPTTIDNATAPKIIEFFWYGCPHCYDIHAPLQHWLSTGKSEEVTFESVPAVASARWAIGGQLYYTAKALDLNIDDAVYDEVHKKNNTGIILDQNRAKSFLISQGVEKSAVEKAWNSFAVKQDLERARQLYSESGLGGVPTFVVNGSNEVPLTGEYEEFFPKLDSLAQSQLTR